MDIIIKSVPDDIGDTFKEKVIAIIEGFLQTRDLKIDKTIEQKFRDDIDAIRIANGLDTKYGKKE